MKNSLPAMAILLAAALIPVTASADVNATNNAIHDNEDATVDNDAAAVRRLLEQFRAAGLSLSQAMTIAEELHKGSRTARVSFEGVRGYRVRTVMNGAIWENTVDAETGRVTGEETALSLNDLSDEDRSNIIALRSVKQELSDAVAVAEKAASGKALGGGLMTEGGKLTFVIVVVSEDRLKQVMLEPPRIARQGSARRNHANRAQSD
jgi:uncharacterized membrane protein YkoI